MTAGCYWPWDTARRGSPEFCAQAWTGIESSQAAQPERGDKDLAEAFSMAQSAALSTPPLPPPSWKVALRSSGETYCLLLHSLCKVLGPTAAPYLGAKTCFTAHSQHPHTAICMYRPPVRSSQDWVQFKICWLFGCWTKLVSQPAEQQKNQPSMVKAGVPNFQDFGHNFLKNSFAQNNVTTL